MKTDPELLKVLNSLAHQLKYLGNGNAATTVGGMEGLGMAVTAAAADISGALSTLGEAIERQTEAIEAVLRKTP